MPHGLYSSIVAGGLFFGMLLCLAIGRRIGLRRMAEDPEGARAGVSPIEGSIFALVGLLIAFTFSGAASRLDTRRALIADEANAIGTAWLRLDLLSETAQPALRDSFRAYLDARLAAYRSMPDVEAAYVWLARATVLQKEIWSSALVACREPAMQQATILLLPALNQMIDITTTRAMVTLMHPPMVIYGLLFSLILGSALLAGYDMAGGQRPSRLHMFSFSATMALAIFVILDLEYPRLGFIRIDAADQVLADVRASMD